MDGARNRVAVGFLSACPASEMLESVARGRLRQVSVLQRLAERRSLTRRRLLTSSTSFRDGKSMQSAT